MKKIIQPKYTINSRRQAPNVNKMLTKARFTTKEDIPSVTKCDNLRCGTCTYIKEGNRIQLKSGMEISPTFQ
jgi:ferredoxin